MPYKTFNPNKDLIMYQINNQRMLKINFLKIFLKNLLGNSRKLSPKHQIKFKISRSLTPMDITDLKMNK